MERRSLGERQQRSRSRPTVIGYAVRDPFTFEITMELDGREITCTGRAPWEARRACEQQLERERQARPQRDAEE
jgi:hypothetical protein